MDLQLGTGNKFNEGLIQKPASKVFLSSRRALDIFFFFVIIIQNKIRNKIQRALSVSQSEAAVMSALLHSTDSRKQVDVFIGLIIIKTTNIIISIINQFEISKILQIIQRQPTFGKSSSLSSLSMWIYGSPLVDRVSWVGCGARYGGVPLTRQMTRSLFAAAQLCLSLCRHCQPYFRGDHRSRGTSSRHWDVDQAGNHTWSKLKTWPPGSTGYI